MSTGQPLKSPRRPYPRRRTVTHSSGRQKSGASSSSGPAASSTTDPQKERFVFIKNKVSAALKAIKQNPKYDWEQSPERAGETAEALIVTMLNYAEGKQGEDEVKGAYTSYIKTYLKETVK